MRRLIVTTLAATVAAGGALADGPGSKGSRWLSGLPVIEADGRGGFHRSGGLVNFDFATAESWDAEGDLSNEAYSFLVAASAPLTQLGWQGTISTVGESWRSEAAILFNTPDPAESFFLLMGATDTSAGTSTYSGSVDLLTALGFNIHPAGTWTLEFYDTYDDVADSIDAHWTNVDIAFVPAPTSAALLGVGALVAARRRR